MAVKKVFRVGDENHLFYEEDITYQYYGGFALSQRQKCIRSLHDSIKKQYADDRILEISSKSMQLLGTKLSAFSLNYFPECLQQPIPVECIFQSSKKFENGGPYTDLLTKLPKDAKRDERLRTSGNLQAFVFEEKVWPLEPRTLFYDWIYINALSQNPQLAEEIRTYRIFTDIEFNHQKSINCQARSVAIFRTLQERGNLDDILQGKIDFTSLYY